MSDETTGGPGPDAKHALATRLRELRLALHGEHGGPAMARLLDLPNRTWLDCETGEAIPGEVLVLLVERTEASPTWLLSGRGPMLRTAPE
jgi:hypothetical protein